VSSPPRLDADLALTIVSDTASAQATSVASVTSETVDVALNGNPRLVVAKSATPATGASPGTSVAWTITVINAGNAPAAGVRVVDPIPGDTTFAGNVTASAGGGAFDAVGNRVVFDVGTLAAGASTGTGWSCSITPLACTRSDALAAGASYPAISVTVDVAADASSPLTTVATVSNAGDTNAANDVAPDVVDVVAAPPPRPPPPPPPPSPEPGAPIPVPTLDEWTMMLLAFLVVAAAWRKRRHVSTD
jgi:uncharacterized repeat protein (TIGR01451 family)